MKKYIILFFLISSFSIMNNYAQGFNGYSWGTIKNIILSNEGLPNSDNIISMYESVLEYDNMIIAGYYTTIIYIFVNDKLYLGNYLFDYLTTQGSINAYKNLFDRLYLKYGKPITRDIIENEILEQNRSPYSIIWNYNEQIIRLKLTYGITGQWRFSITYQISPELASIASGGKIRDHIYGDL